MNYCNVDIHGPTAPISDVFLSSQVINPSIASLPDTADADLQEPIKILMAKGQKSA